MATKLEGPKDDVVAVELRVSDHCVREVHASDLLLKKLGPIELVCAVKAKSELRPIVHWTGKVAIGLSRMEWQNVSDPAAVTQDAQGPIGNP